MVFLYPAPWRRKASDIPTRENWDSLPVTPQPPQPGYFMLRTKS